MSRHKGSPHRLTAANVIPHFWALVDQSGGSDACWPWTRSKTGSRRDYGSFRWNGIPNAHSAAYYFTTGIRGTICHTCDNPICCNPKHLYAGTQNGNMQDMARRNRTSSKLSVEQVRRILVGDEPSRVLAKELGVDKRSISRIRRGGSWKYHDARGPDKEKDQRIA